MPRAVRGRRGLRRDGRQRRDAGQTGVAGRNDSPSAERVRGLDVSAHARNFFDSVKTRKPTVCNSSVMRHSHVACHAAALSWILNRKLKLDPEKEEFIDDAEANRLKSRPAQPLERVVAVARS